MGLILCVDHVDRLSTPNDDVRDEMAERAAHRILPSDRNHGFAAPTRPNLSTDQLRFPTDDRFHISLPQLLQRQRPGETIQFPPAAESPLLLDPGYRLDTEPQGFV